MTYKINYDSQTTLVLGKYPSTLYQNAPEPNIEISDAEYKRIFGDGLFQTPCVVNGIIQELVRSDSEILQKAKALKLAQITPARDAFMYADIEYNGSIFTNSQVSGNNITSALAIMGTSINWLDTSGNLVVMTKTQLKELGALIIDKRNIGYFQEANLTNQINACTTIEQVNAINITF
ncbi:MAG: DUF4376 domain-containing protein [Flavobacterium sp.]